MNTPAAYLRTDTQGPCVRLKRPTPVPCRITGSGGRREYVSFPLQGKKSAKQKNT